MSNFALSTVGRPCIVLALIKFKFDFQHVGEVVIRCCDIYIEGVVKFVKV